MGDNFLIIAVVGIVFLAVLFLALGSTFRSKNLDANTRSDQEGATIVGPNRANEPPKVREP